MTTATRLLDPVWLTPSQAAPLLGLHPKTVRQLCADRLIEHRLTTGPAGQPRYHIDRAAVDAYNRTHTRRVA